MSGFFSVFDVFVDFAVAASFTQSVGGAFGMALNALGTQPLEVEVKNDLAFSRRDLSRVISCVMDLVA